MDDILILIESVFNENENGEQIESDGRSLEVWAHSESISRAEWYEAGRNGFAPSLVVTTPRSNYSGEHIAIWNGKRYEIYRTYYSDDNENVELYLEEKAGVDGKAH